MRAARTFTPPSGGGTDHAPPCRGCRHFHEPAWCFHPDLALETPVVFVTGQKGLRAIPVETARLGNCGYGAALWEVGPMAK